MAKRKRTIELTIRAPIQVIQALQEIANIAGMDLSDISNLILAMELWRLQKTPAQGKTGKPE